MQVNSIVYQPRVGFRPASGFVYFPFEIPFEHLLSAESAMRVKIVNWKKYNNPRKNIKSTTWFRFQNDYFIDPDFCDLPHDQKLVFPYLCSLASKKMNGEFDVSESLACAILKIDVLSYESAFNHLLSSGIIEIPTSRKRRTRVAHESTSSDTHARRNINGTERNINGTERNDRDGYDGHSAAAEAPSPPLALSTPPEKPVRARTPRKDPNPSTDGGKVWEAYRGAYQARYGQEPVRNAKVNAQCAQLVGRLGAESAIDVVRFYLTHQSRWYVQNVHALGLCLKDAEGLHTQMRAGHRVSVAESQNKDRQQGNMQAFKAVADKLKAEGYK